MAEIYLDSVTGSDSTGTGSRQKPFKTYGLIDSFLTPGDVVWLRGTFTETIEIKTGTTLRQWGIERFLVDGESSRAQGVSVPDEGASDWQIFGCEMIGHVNSGFVHTGYVANGRLFDCFSHDNTGNGFSNFPVASPDDQGVINFYGCLAVDNGNDGFSVAHVTVWNCYDCLSTGHTNAAASDGYTTHGSAYINAYRCVAEDCTKGFSYTHHTGHAVVANCHASNVEIGLIHRPSVSFAEKDNPSTLAFGNVFSLNGNSVNGGQQWGVGAGNGALVNSICNTVYNPGNLSDSDRCISFATTNDSNAGGAATRIRVIGCVSEGTSDAQMYHCECRTLSNALAWDINVYRDQGGDHYRIGGSAITKDEWLAQAGGFDSASYFVSGAVLDGEPSTEATLDNGRLSAAGQAARILNVKNYMEDLGILHILDALELPPEMLAGDSMTLYNDVLTPRHFPLVDSVFFMSVNGGPLDLTETTMTAGAFAEGAKTNITHAGKGVSGGIFRVSDYSVHAAGLSDRRVNLRSVAGSRTKRIRILNGDFLADSNQTPDYAKLTAGKSQAGKVMSQLVANIARDFDDILLPIGEDLFLTVNQQANTSVDLEIHYQVVESAPMAPTVLTSPGDHHYDA
ncbi:MAG: hypothetical protein JKY94_17580 [Rhodobacteraceae bacterium]|nr:hypothetical protein [Paracoccaceae bacterium]